MTVIVAIPATVVRGTVVMDHARDWSIVDEMLLLGLSLGTAPSSVGGLAQASGLPHQVVVASLARLMRFRLVEVRPDGTAAAFAASAAGAELVRTGAPLPRFPRELPHRFGFAVERYSGCYFRTGEVRLARAGALVEDRGAGHDVRIVPLQEDGEVEPHEASVARLVGLLERNGERRLVKAHGRTVTRRDDLLVCIRVVGGVPRNLPASASEDLRGLVRRVATADAGSRALGVTPVGSGLARRPTSFDAVPCAFDPGDLVVEGKEQRALLERILSRACSRVVLHSTFLDAAKFDSLAPKFREACLRGVEIDLLWGADEHGEEPGKNGRAAIAIAAAVAEDPVLAGRLRTRMGSTQSHSKMLLADDGEGGWLAVVSSCNWLYSPFSAAEVSVVLRHPLAVADAVDVVQGMVERTALADDLATKLFLLSRELRDAASARTIDGSAAPSGSVRLMVGQAHERAMREASGRVSKRLVVGSNRLGSTAWSGALLPGELAASKPGVTATVLYRYTSGPLKRRHEGAVVQEACARGVRVLRTDKVPLHGKFVLWDDDDVMVTSLNWASASTDDRFPAGEVGVHVRAPGLAQDVFARLQAVFEELQLQPAE